MPPEQLALIGLTWTTMGTTIAFLYKLLERSDRRLTEAQRREAEALASERATAARYEGNTRALEALTDVLGRP